MKKHMWNKNSFKYTYKNIFYACVTGTKEISLPEFHDFLLNQ